MLVLLRVGATINLLTDAFHISNDNITDEMTLLSFRACNTVLVVLICNLVVILGVNLAVDDCVYIARSFIYIFTVFNSSPSKYLYYRPLSCYPLEGVVP